PEVGGLPDDLQFELIEPLKSLFKDEVRAVGLELGLPESMVWRQPFPGPGLAIRIVGAVDAERLATVREADAIAREELEAAGLERDVWQFPVVLLADVRSVGVQGDGRTYAHQIVLRPITSEDAMTADWERLVRSLRQLLVGHRCRDDAGADADDPSTALTPGHGGLLHPQLIDALGDGVGRTEVGEVDVGQRTDQVVGGRGPELGFPLGR